MNEPHPLVYVVDDDPSIRQALARLLKVAGFQVEVFSSAEAFLARPRPEGPACAILDLHLPGLNGLDLQRALVEEQVNLPVVFLSGHGDIPKAVRAMKAGAVDFLLKPFDDEDLLAAVQLALAQATERRRGEAERAEVRRRAQSLTPREREVMDLVVTGLPNKHVAQKLGVVEKTVKVHRGRVMDKMGAGSLPDLVRMAEQLNGAGSL
jgi:FixJ family two-component response regulator